MSRWRAIAAAFAVILAAGCRGPTTYVHPGADLRDVRVVAVLPFENLSADRAAGDRVQQLLVAELMSMGGFIVVEPGLVTTAMGDLSRRAAPTPDDLKRLAESLHADALFLGTLLNYSEPRGRDPAEVTLGLRLIDARSGLTMWLASETRNGGGFAAKLFGLRGETGTELARTLIRAELATLVE